MDRETPATLEKPCKKVQEIVQVHACPHGNVLAPNLKYVNVNINGKIVSAMLDTGCTKTCARNGESFLIGSQPTKSSMRLLCANNEYLTTFGLAKLKISFSSSLQLENEVLLVDKLSAPLIIGLDLIKSFQFDENSPYVMLNNHKLQLANKSSLPMLAHVAETTTLNPNEECIVNIKNKNFSPDQTTIMVNKLKSNSPRDKFLVSPGIYENSGKINIIVTNRSPKPIRLHKGQKLCTLEPIQIAKCNSVRMIPENIEESKNVQDFQDQRENKADEINFKPEIGSFGAASQTEIRKLTEMLQNYRLAFCMGPKDLGKLGYFRFQMPLLDETKTAHQPPRPIPIHLREKVDNEMEKWEELGLIEPTQSGFNIPLIILKKADGSIRISLDARQLNTLLKPDRYPLPHMRSVFTTIGEKLTNSKNCYISSFDWYRGYWQVQCDTEDAHKTAFSYKNEHYQAKRMLYGTSTAPSCFARIMMKIFGGHKSFVIYLDDLLVVDSTFEEHQKSLEFLFEQCIKFGVILNGKKCNLCQETVEFLGHQIDHNGVKPLEKHKLAVSNFPAPTDKKGVKTFLGLVNYNLRYIEKASITLSPLYRICSTKTPFIWEEPQEEAFNQIKNDLLSAKGLHHRNPSLNLVLVCDASKYGSGGTLYQDNEGQLETIGYTSKKFTDPEIRRSMREKELFGLSYAVRAFEYYLIGTEFVIVSDHKSLLYLYREHLRTSLDVKLVNIWTYLQNFSFEIVHRPGDSPIMASADCISRLPRTTMTELEKQCGLEIPDRVFSMCHFPTQEDPKMRMFLRSMGNKDNIPAISTETAEEIEKPVLEFGEYSIKAADMESRQNDCSEIQNISKKLVLKSKTMSKKFFKEDNLLYQKGKSKKKLVLPKTLGAEFALYTHVAYGHCGTFQLMKILSQYVFIPQIKAVATDVCKKCIDCLRMKPQKMLKPSLIPKRQFEEVPFQKTSLDLYDLGKPDSNGKRYLVTICCHLTGFADGVPISRKTDLLVSKAVLELILRYGINGTVIADNGREFGNLTQQVLERFRIRLVRTSAYMSRSNGKVERVHREITAKMKLMKVNHRNWSEQWSFIRFLINNLPKTSLDGLSATECVFGRSLFVPFEYIEPIDGNESVPFVKALNMYLEELHPSLMKFQYEKYSAMLKKDKNGAETLKIGRKCLVWKPCISEGKLTTQWAGPYTVLKKTSKDSYILKNEQTFRTFRRNIRHLRPLKIDEPDTDANLSEETAEVDHTENLREQDEFAENLFIFDNLPQFSRE